MLSVTISLELICCCDDKIKVTELIVETFKNIPPKVWECGMEVVFIGTQIY